MHNIALINRRMAGSFATLAITLLALAQPAFAQQLIQNGSFETNDGPESNVFANWTVVDQSGSAGSWYVQSSSNSPINGNEVSSPPHLDFAAMTDQGGPGSHVLYQDFLVPTGVTEATLSFRFLLNNQGGAYFNPDSLDYNTESNQQFRVDIITTSADLFSVAPADVLVNAYQTNPGDALSTGYLSYSGDITSLLQEWGGQTLRLRFSEVDNQDVFNVGVDNVALNVTAGAAAPEPATCVLALTALPMAGLALRRRRKA